ncbi:Protein OS-9 [Kluyveromyces marxianus]|nr:Protein OS-9 [Kluyveromyces marxianus]
MVSVLVFLVLSVTQFARLVFSEPVKDVQQIPYSLKYVDEDFFDAITGNETLMSKGKVVRIDDTECFYSTSPDEPEIMEEEELSEIEVRSLSQSHDKTKFILGQSANYNSTSDYSYEGSDDMPYIKQILNNGTICDITGRPRKTEIRYYCTYDAFSPIKISIEEVQTCQYVEKIFIPELCRFKSMNRLVEEFSAHRIYCHKAQNNVSSLFYLLNHYSFQPCPKDIFLLTPNDRSVDRPVIMFRTELTDKEASVTTVEDKFIESLLENLEYILKMEFIRTPEGGAIMPGDVFLWRAPVMDLDGQLLFLIDLEFNSASQAIARINYDISMLDELPLHNVVTFSRVLDLETTPNPNYGPSKVYKIFQNPVIHPPENIEEDAMGRKIAEALSQAFAEAGLEGFDFQMVEADI